MKIRDKKAKVPAQKVEPKSKLKTPDVIALKDESTPSKEPAPASFAKGENDDLAAAATNPAAALNDNVEDAVFEEPKTEAEIAAEAILEQTETEVVEPVEDNSRPTIAALCARPTEAPESSFANFSYTLVSEGGQKLLEWLKARGTEAAKLFNQAKLRVVAFGNDVWDGVKKFGNKCWAAYDFTKKNPQWFYIWLKERQTKLTIWAEHAKMDLDKLLAEWAEKRAADKAARLHNKTQAIRELTTAILNCNEEMKLLRGVHEQEMRRVCKRVTKLQETVEELKKKQAGSVSVEQVDAFVLAIREGRNAKASDIYRGITGASLTDAKALFEVPVQ